MKKDEDTPLWVFLAFSSINTRKGALLLIWSCTGFTIYCAPWPLLFPDLGWAKSAFLVDDWSWFAMMVPVTAWYWLGLRWMDNNSSWDNA